MIAYKTFTVKDLNWSELAHELGKDGWYPISILRLEDGQFHLVFAKRRTDRAVKYAYFETPAPDVPKNSWLDQAYWEMTAFFCGLYQTADGNFMYVFYSEEEYAL